MVDDAGAVALAREPEWRSRMRRVRRIVKSDGKSEEGSTVAARE